VALLARRADLPEPSLAQGLVPSSRGLGPAGAGRRPPGTPGAPLAAGRQAVVRAGL